MARIHFGTLSLLHLRDAESNHYVSMIDKQLAPSKGFHFLSAGPHVIKEFTLSFKSFRNSQNKL